MNHATPAQVAADAIVNLPVAGYRGLMATVCRQTGTWHAFGKDSDQPVVTLYVPLLDAVHRGVRVRLAGGELTYVSGGPDVGTWKKRRAS